MNFELISVLLFLGVLAILIYRDRKNIEFKSGIIMRRSNAGKDFIYKFSEKYEKTLRIIGNIGIVVAAIATFFAMFILMQSTYKLITKPSEATGSLKLVLPSVSGVKLPGFILGVPFWYWIIAVFLVVSIHEPMHALMARIEKVRIKSFGLILLIILPGAFVDPDEKQLKKLSIVKKLRVYAAGSFGNLLLAGVVFLLLIGYNFALSKLLTPVGIAFEKTIPNSGAALANMTGRITAINSVEVRDFDDLGKAMSTVKPNDIIVVNTTTRQYVIRTVADPDNSTRPLIGIENSYVVFAYSGFLSKFGTVSNTVLSIIMWISGLFSWVFLLSLGVGIFNLFPLKPLDGGLILEEVSNHFFKRKKSKIITRVVSTLVLILILFNLFWPSVIKIFSF